MFKMACSSRTSNDSPPEKLDNNDFVKHRGLYSSDDSYNTTESSLLDSDLLTFNRLKVIFRGPEAVKKLCTSDVPNIVDSVDDCGNATADYSKQRSSITSSFTNYSKDMYTCPTMSTVATSLTDFSSSFDMLKPNLGGFDNLGDALVADNAAYCDKEHMHNVVETPQTQLAYSDVSQNVQDIVTPVVGAVDLRATMDFTERISKCLERFLAGDNMAQEELISLCVTEFNLSDSQMGGFTPAITTVLLRFCLLKGQLYLAGQFLQVALDKKLNVSADDIVEVLVALCSGDAIGLTRNIFSRLDLLGYNVNDISKSFTIRLSKSLSYRVYSNFLLLMEDISSLGIAPLQFVFLIDDFVINVFGLYSSSKDRAISNEEMAIICYRFTNLNNFHKTSQTTWFNICIGLSFGTGIECNERIQQLLSTDELMAMFLEHVYTYQQSCYTSIVLKFISHRLLKGLGFICALYYAHAICQSGATSIKLTIAAQQKLTCVVPENLRKPGFGDWEFLSCSGITKLIHVLGNNFQSSLLSICSILSALGRDLFTPLVESCLIVQDFVAVDSILRYIVEFYGNVPFSLVATVLQCQILYGYFPVVIQKLTSIKNSWEGADKNSNSSSVSADAMERLEQLIDFGLRVTIASCNFDVALEFCKLTKCGQKVSTELSMLIQHIPTILNSRSKLDTFLNLCEQLCLDENAFAAVLDCCLRLRNSKRLLRLIKKFRRLGLQPQLQTYGVIIKSLGCCGRINECKQIWHELAMKRGYEPNEVTYGIMLDALVNNNKVDDAMAFFQEMKSKGNIKPNTIMYTTLIKGFGQNKQLNKAMKIYHLMCQEHVARNTVTYNSIIDACARVGDMKGAASFLEEMLQNDVEPDLITFSTIIKGYCVQSNMDQSFQLLGIMYERGIMPDGILYNSLLEGCVKSGRLWLCERLWEQMQQHGIPPSNFTLTILIKMYGRSGQLDKVFELVGRLPVEYNFTINAHVYTCLMSACITNQRYSTALEIYKCMKKGGIKPDAKTFETLIHGATRGALYAQATEVINDLYNLKEVATTDSYVIQNVNVKIVENLFSKVQYSADLETIATYNSLAKKLHDLYSLKLEYSS